MSEAKPPEAPQKRILETKTEKTYTTKEIAGITGMTPSHFNSLIQTERLKAKKDEAGRWQIPQSEVDKYLSGNIVKPRKRKEFTDKMGNDSPENPFRALEKEREEVKRLSHELNAAKILAEELGKKLEETQHSAEEKIKFFEERIDRYERVNARVKDDNKALRAEIRDHNDFLRNTLRDVLYSFMGVNQEKPKAKQQDENSEPL